MLTRRQFLATTAALALPQRGPSQQILVLGGGLAGLCTAYELQRLGHSVTVLEAQRRPGGRVHTVREPYAPGLYTEAGAEQIPGAHDITQRYARELGLTLLADTARGQTRYFVHGRHTTANELRLNDLFAKYITPATEQVRTGGFPQQTPRALASLDPYTLGAWLRQQGASPAEIELLALGFGTDFGSAAAYVLHGVNASGGRGSYRIEGGNDRIPFEFAKRVNVRYGAAAIAVAQDDRQVTVTVQSVRGVEKLTAERLVCALPCPVIGRLFDDARLSDAKLHAIREQNYSRTVKVFLQTRTRFWLKDGWNGFGETDLPIERLTPDPGGDPESRGALTAYPIGPYAVTLERMSEDDRISAAFEQGKQIFPELATAFEGGVAYCWGLDPWQRGSFAFHAPGQIGFLDTLAKPEGRIHFAGEHTSPWTGWMQGALESAQRVVREIR